MSEQENIHVVQQFYRAFGRGDMQAVLNAVADDVKWHEPGPTDILPWAGTRRGRDQVAQFLAAVDEALEVQQFELQEFIAQDDKVVVLGRGRSRVRPTGRTFDSPWTMVFTLCGGKICGFSAYHDTAAMVAATTDRSL